MFFESPPQGVASSCSSCSFSSRPTATQCRRSAWPKSRHWCASHVRREVQPWLVIKNFVSEAERFELLESAMAQKQPGPRMSQFCFVLPCSGPSRYFRRLDATGGVDSLVEALTARLESALDLGSRPRDVTLGRVCSYIEPGGFIHEHRDRYVSETSGLAGLSHLRANVVVQMEKSGQPIIAGKSVPVEEGDAWVFLASKELHATALIEGLKPRIVFGFGWSVPGSYLLPIKT
ncbi:unnamed protein product [Effrenium voratum]|nr:unnamed protein product [Effrenium voratum]